MKQIRQIFLFLLILALGDCKQRPTFPASPEISFLSVKKITVNDSENKPNKDSVAVSINFKDGDGDLGSSDANVINYYVDVFALQNGEYKQVIEKDTIPIVYHTKNGRFPALNPDGRQGPIEGILERGFTTYLIFKPFNDSAAYTLKYKIYIKDNNGHSSNVIETSPVRITNYLYNP